MTAAGLEARTLDVPGPWEDSPLALLLRDERTHRLLTSLASQLDGLRRARASASPAPTLVLPTPELEYARARWEAAVLYGEHRLYDLAMLLAWELLATRRIQRVARIVASPAGERTDHRIVIEEPVEREELQAISDWSLAEKVVRRYRWRGGGDAEPFGRLLARASFLELRPLEGAAAALATRVLTRVKVEDQIWNKVCDALFDVDHLIERDKLLNPASKYVKDVFGIKVLTTSTDVSYRVAARLSEVSFDAASCEAVGIMGPVDTRLELLESKDYLALPADQKKKTGWEAIKNVYRWCGQVFEMQIQTEANYFLEASDLSKTSHRTFEMQRKRLRARLEKRVPHYGEFRALLRLLFASTPPSRPACLPDWLRIDP